MPSICSGGSVMSTSVGQRSNLPVSPAWSDDDAIVTMPNAITDSDEDLSSRGPTPGRQITGRPAAEAWGEKPVMRSRSRSTEETSRSTYRRSRTKTRLSARKAEECIIASKREEMEVAQSRIQMITSSRAFEVYVMAIVLLNTVFIGWQTQDTAVDVEESFYTGHPYHVSTP